MENSPFVILSVECTSGWGRLRRPLIAALSLIARLQSRYYRRQDVEISQEHRVSYWASCLAYPQTWTWFAYPRTIKRYMAEWLCGKIIGHEVSKTERGHAFGSNVVDFACRWCNKNIPMPLREEPDLWAILKGDGHD